MMEIRRSHDRGSAELDWLQSRHTFSFGSYHDPEHMGVSALRVINDDRVKPGAGFATHSHRDMEIISYVKHGAIEHKDSIGNVDRLPAGEFQLMSAGTGVTHSEYNPSESDPLEFLQIWIVPDRKGISPAYQQKRFDPAVPLALVASPDGADDSLGTIAGIPLYDEDLREEGSPESVTTLANAISDADAILMSTPEYNYSVPGVLKNAIDWLSRLDPQPFAGKPLAIMGASMGRLGTSRAQYHLRQTFVYLDAMVLNRPEVMIGAAHTLVDDANNLTDETTRANISGLLEALATHARRLAG